MSSSSGRMDNIAKLALKQIQLEDMHNTLYRVTRWIDSDMYRAFFPVSSKVFKTMIWEIPPAEWLILQLPTAQAGPRNLHGKK